MHPRNVIHVTTHNNNLYILITKYQSKYFDDIKMFYYIHVTFCILIHSEYILYGWHVTVLQKEIFQLTLRTSSNVLVLRIYLIYHSSHFSSNLS